MSPLLGDRVTPGLSRGRVLAEVVGLWLGTLLAIRGVVTVQRLGLPEVVLAAVPLLFIYAPVAWCRARDADSWAYRLSIPAFRDVAAWGSALRLAAGSTLLVSVPFGIGYHLYQTRLFGAEITDRVPEGVAVLVAYHVFFVAIPEEFFY